VTRRPVSISLTTFVGEPSLLQMAEQRLRGPADGVLRPVAAGTHLVVLFGDAYADQ